MAKRKIKTAKEITESVAAAGDDAAPCAMCYGTGSEPDNYTKSGDSITCPTCLGTGEEPQEWAEACKRAGVPDGRLCFGSEEGEACGGVFQNKSGHTACARYDGGNCRNGKCPPCFDDIAARVLKIRAKAGENGNGHKPETKPEKSEVEELPAEPPSAPAELSHTEPTTLDLLVAVDNERALAMGKELGDLEVERVKLEAEKKKAVADFNAEISGLDDKIAQIAPLVAAGSERQPVKCTITFNHTEKKKTCTRNDTGAEVWAHDYSTEDLQRFNLFTGNPLDQKPVYAALQEGVANSAYERACRELNIPGGLTCKGEVFCEDYIFETERRCLKYLDGSGDDPAIEIDASGAPLKCAQCRVAIEALAATLDKAEPVAEGADTAHGGNK